LNVKTSKNDPQSLASEFVSGVLSRMGVAVKISSVPTDDEAADAGRIDLKIDGAPEHLAGQRDFWISLGMLASQNVSRGQTQRSKVYLNLGDVVADQAGEAPRVERAERPERADRPERAPRPAPVQRAARAAGSDPEAFLADLAAEIAEVVRQTGSRAVIERLGNTERRAVHTALADAEGVRTRSEGSEANRHLLVEPVR
jgi:predicted RNA-binding protein Jag